MDLDRSSLTIKRGETGSYRIRLSERPIADNWWLFIFADREKRDRPCGGSVPSRSLWQSS